MNFSSGTTLSRRPLRQIAQSIASDVRAGFVEITRHSMAALGLTVVAVVLAFMARPELQTAASEYLLGWLSSQQSSGQSGQNSASSPGASRSTAVATRELTAEQLSVTQWLSRKYKVSPEPMGALVTEAWAVGELSQVPPTLILAVMAVESNFNPFAQRSERHRGLMQIDSTAQQSALTGFGGPLSVFDPLTNLRLGSRVLQSFILEAGSLEDGVKAFAQTSPQGADGTYTERVLAEYQLLEQLVQTRATAASHTVQTGPKRF